MTDIQFSCLKYEQKLVFCRSVLKCKVLQVQQCIDYLVNEALRMGAHPDDRDSVTDMTLLMFTCKAGAAGVGDGSQAAKVRIKLENLLLKILKLCFS